LVIRWKWLEASKWETLFCKAELELLKETVKEEEYQKWFEDIFKESKFLKKEFRWLQNN
jgi:hypothetical protein